MSKTLSFKGQLAVGLQERIKLSTKDGKTGYQIKKFQTISSSPGDGDHETIMQIFATDQTGAITAAVNFSEGDLLAVSYNKEQGNATSPGTQTIVFDNEIFNQDIFVTLTDATGGTKPANYYIELEVMSLTDIQSTQLTLRSLRQIAAR